MRKSLLYFVALLFCFTVHLSAQTSDNEKAAREWIKSQEKELNIKPEHSFKLTFVRKGLAGETLRFQQMLNDVPVFESEIVVNFSYDNAVAFSSNSYDATVEKIETNPRINANQAISISNANLNAAGGKITFQQCKLYIYNLEKPTRLAYRVSTQINNKPGDWEVFVDANTSQVISLKDIAIYDHVQNGVKVKKNQKRVKKESKIPFALTTGTAMVYDADPLSATHNAYGGNYVDNNDATNAQLDAARTAVVLPQIDLTGGVYRLKSQYVDIADFQPPNKGLFTQTTNAFNFTRDNDAFEAVNSFYHLDKSMRYINQTLGVVCVPQQNGGVFQFDPSGLNGVDNSEYLSATGQIAFGEGCVDDAEDADVILHEFGHGIHDWMTGGNSSSKTGLGEGCGDYWAMSYSRSLNQWAVADPAYQYVFSWDGHNECWEGRVTNVTATYPQTGGVNTEVHTYGQIWATALMKIYDVIGRTKTDTAFLEGLALTNSNSRQPDAAKAVRQAAINMCYSCADIQTMTDKFNQAGYNMPAVALKICCPGPQTVNAAAGNTYTVPSFASLSNAISANCSAVVTQSPAVGAVLAPGTYPVTMTATSGTTVNCNFNLIVQANLGVNDVVKQHAIVIYPNPATSVLNIKGQFDASEKVSITNVLGQTVLNYVINSSDSAIDISKLSKGVYILNFESSKTPFKFVKE